MDTSPELTDTKLKTELQAIACEIKKAALFLSDMLSIFQYIYCGAHKEESLISQDCENCLFNLCSDAYAKQIQMVQRLEKHLQLSGKQIDTGLEMWEIPDDSTTPLTQ